MLPAKEQAAVDFGMQRLHAPAEHFGPAGEVGNVTNADSVLAQEFRGSPSRENFDFPSCQTLRESHNSCFVKDAEERALYGHASLREGNRTV